MLCVPPSCPEAGFSPGQVSCPVASGSRIRPPLSPMISEELRTGLSALRGLRGKSPEACESHTHIRVGSGMGSEAVMATARLPPGPSCPSPARSCHSGQGYRSHTRLLAPGLSLCVAACKVGTVAGLCSSVPLGRGDSYNTQFPSLLL